MTVHRLVQAVARVRSETRGVETSLAFTRTLATARAFQMCLGNGLLGFRVIAGSAVSAALKHTGDCARRLRNLHGPLLYLSCFV
jgi:hypothetical protein